MSEKFTIKEMEILSLCSGRSESEIKAAFALWDNREKVVEKLEAARRLQCSTDADPHTAEYCDTIFDIITAALALLQAEKEGGK